MSKESYRVESGIHVHALLKDNLSFFPIILYNPPFEIWYGKYSGTRNFRAIFGDSFTQEEYEEMRDIIKDYSVRKNRSFSASEVKNILKKHSLKERTPRSLFSSRGMRSEDKN